MQTMRTTCMLHSNIRTYNSSTCIVMKGPLHSKMEDEDVFLSENIEEEAKQKVEEIKAEKVQAPDILINL